MTTGEKIATLRRELGLSQEALGEKLGLSRQAVSKWEADQAVPGMDNLVELARLFGVPVDTLLRPDEPLPGKSEQSEEQNPPETVSIDDCSDPHMPEWTRKMRWIIWGVAGLLCASVVCNVVSLVWLSQLQNQVNGMPLGVNTVYIPDNSISSQQNSDLTDFSVDCKYDSPTDSLLFTAWAIPREAVTGEAAQFSIKNGSRTFTADAEPDGGGYRATITAPLLEGDYSVLLLLSADGKTRSIAVDTVYHPMEQYRLTVVEGNYLSKESTVEVQVKVPASQQVWPVKGTVTVVSDGQKNQVFPLDNMENPYEKDEEATEITLYCRAYGVKRSNGAELLVSVVDNCGRITEYQIA